MVRDSFDGAGPSAVNGGDDAAVGIMAEQRHTVGGEDADEQSAFLGVERIAVCDGIVHGAGTAAAVRMSYVICMCAVRLSAQAPVRQRNAQVMAQCLAVLHDRRLIMRGVERSGLLPADRGLGREAYTPRTAVRHHRASEVSFVVTSVLIIAHPVWSVGASADKK